MDYALFGGSGKGGLEGLVTARGPRTRIADEKVVEAQRYFLKFLDFFSMFTPQKDTN